MLASSVEDPALRERRLKFLAGLSPSRREGDVLYVHGSPQMPVCGYVFPEDAVWYQKKLNELGTYFDRICFRAGDGIPGLFVKRWPWRWKFIRPEDCARGFRVAGRRVICNVGAVGYPRDGDWRACYALFDGETIWFRRVEYDVETTIRKIAAVPVLANHFGGGLREGRASGGIENPNQDAAAERRGL
ncbi:MAG: hypothetical protein U0793_09415 [Gemmataceae bacterium]